MFKKISPNKWILTLIIAWCGACVFAQDKDSILAKITEIEYTLSQLQQQKNEALLVIEKEKAKAVKEVDELTEKK